MARKKKRGKEAPEQEPKPEKKKGGLKISLGKKGKGGDAAPEEAVEKKSDREPSLVGRNKKESVLFESSFAAAADLFRGNKLFCTKRAGQSVWVGIRLNLDDIGGLSAKDKRDESKGQIINLINSGKLSTLFTKALEEEGAIIFIPNKDTVRYMSEFTLLADRVKYELVLLDYASEGSYERTEIYVTLNSLQGLHRANRNVDTLEGMDDVLVGIQVKDAVEASLEDVSDREVPILSEYDMIEQRPEEDDEFVGKVDDVVLEKPAEPPRAAAMEGELDSDLNREHDVFDEGFGDDEEDEEDVGVGEEEEAVFPAVTVPDEPIYISEEDQERAMNRKFFNEDLTCELDTSGLEQALAPSVPLAITAENSSWLGDQYNFMVAIANEELLSKHNANMNLVRQHYLDGMVAIYNEEVASVMDIEHDHRYPQVQAAEAEANRKRDEQVLEAKKRLEEDWKAEIAEIGEAARKNAEASHRMRYKAMHEEQLRNITLEGDRLRDAMIQAAEDMLRDARKKEAMHRIDLRSQQLITAALEEYKGLAVAEQDMFMKFNGEVRDWLEKHRIEETTRIQTLKAEMEQGDRVAQIRDDYSAQMAMVKQDSEFRMEQMKRDLEEMQRRHETSLKAKENEAVYAREQAERDLAKKDARIDTLIADFGRSDEMKEQKYGGQIQELKRERDSVEQKYQDVVQMQKKRGKLGVLVTILGVVAALAVGFVAGNFLSLGRDSGQQAMQSPGYSQSQQAYGDTGVPGAGSSGNRDDDDRDAQDDRPAERDDGGAEKDGE